MLSVTLAKHQGNVSIQVIGPSDGSSMRSNGMLISSGIGIVHPGLRSCFTIVIGLYRGAFVSCHPMAALGLVLLVALIPGLSLDVLMRDGMMV